MVSVDDSGRIYNDLSNYRHMVRVELLKKKNFNNKDLYKKSFWDKF